MTARAQNGVLSFGGFSLDPERGLLLRSGEIVHIRAKTFALLSYFSANPGRVLSKDELIDAIWPDVEVTEDSLTQTVRDLRRALGPEGEGLVRTVPRRGYVLEVAAPSRAAEAHGEPGRPRIVVLPFRTISPDPADAVLIDGLAEELTLGLGRYGQLFVVAPHTAFRFRPEEVAPQAAAAEIGAAYFVEGTARRAGPALTLGLSLCATDTGRALWGESFALDADTLGEVQSALPNRVVSRLDLDVQQQLGVLAAPSATRDLGAYGHLAAAVALLRSFGPGVNERGKAHLQEALALDPGFGLAHAYLGLAEIILGDYGAADTECLNLGLAHARRGVTLAPEEARCHAIAAIAHLYRKEFAAAEAMLRRALALNPHFADAMMILGEVLAQRGRPEEGQLWAERAIRLNPLHPEWYHHDFAMILRASGQYREAIAQLHCWPKESAARETRLAACYAALDEGEAAARHIRQARALSPGWDAVAEADSIEGFETLADTERFRAEVAKAVAFADG